MRGGGAAKADLGAPTRPTMDNMTFPLVLKQPEASEWLWLRRACLSDTGHLARYIKTLKLQLACDYNWAPIERPDGAG